MDFKILSEKVLVSQSDPYINKSPKRFVCCLDVVVQHLGRSEDGLAANESASRILLRQAEMVGASYIFNYSVSRIDSEHVYARGLAYRSVK